MNINVLGTYKFQINNNKFMLNVKIFAWYLRTDTEVKSNIFIFLR